MCHDKQLDPCLGYVCPSKSSSRIDPTSVEGAKEEQPSDIFE